MKQREAAFAILAELARINGVCARESELLHRYRSALRVSRRRAGLLLRVPDGGLLVERLLTTAGERTNVMRMLVAVSLADDHLCGSEQELLQNVARRLGIGPVEFAEIVVAAERRRDVHRAHRTRWVAAICAGLGLGLTSVVVAAMSTSEGSTAGGRNGIAVTDRSAGSVPPLTADEKLQTIERDFRSSVLLVYSRYDLRRGSESRRFAATGTGFFVSPLGHIVTNKHVVQGWKFDADVKTLENRGWVVDDSSVLIAVWPEGAEMRSSTGKLRLRTGYSTATGDLALDRTAPDSFLRMARERRDGSKHVDDYHRLDDHDLAMLKADVPVPVRSFQIRSGRPARLERVLLLGFPLGLRFQETGRAVLTPRAGNVLTAENALRVDMEVFQGNSGGPVVDLAGRVVGIASKNLGDPNLGECIRAAHLIELLPEPEGLLRAADELIDSHRYEAALDLTRLASLDDPSPLSREAIDRMQSRLLEVLDRDLDSADAFAAAGEYAEAEGTYGRIVELFGPVWGRPAVEGLRVTAAARRANHRSRR